MKIYLDTGNVEEIEKAAKSGILDGVTTNPTLIAKEGRDFKTVVKEIVKIMKKYGSKNFTVSAEVTDTSSADVIIKKARELAKIDSHIMVKIPLIPAGIEAVSVLSKEKIKTNVTLCFSANQALLAAKAGATVVSPFIGRIDDEGYNGLELISDIRTIFDNYNFKTEILSASIRSTSHVLECAKIGSDIVTIPTAIFTKLYYNPLTDIGLKKFESDWENYQKKLQN